MISLSFCVVLVAKVSVPFGQLLHIFGKSLNLFRGCRFITYYILLIFKNVAAHVIGLFEFRIVWKISIRNRSIARPKMVSTRSLAFSKRKSVPIKRMRRSWVVVRGEREEFYGRDVNNWMLIRLGPERWQECRPDDRDLIDKFFFLNWHLYHQWYEENNYLLNTYTLSPNSNCFKK